MGTLFFYILECLAFQKEAVLHLKLNKSFMKRVNSYKSLYRDKIAYVIIVRT